jgi:DNA polymerase III delta prime subunit
MDTTLFDKILSSQTRTLPLILDEISALDYISRHIGVTLESLDECKTGNFENIYLYEKEEDKTYISVKIIRNWILDLSEKPYRGKNIYILRNFDEATIEAMNASLKALEEPPEHAVILLVVKNPENLLETIRSRTLNLYQKMGENSLSPDIQLSIEKFIKGDVKNLISLLQTEKLDETTLFLILFNLLKICQERDADRIEKRIEELLEVNENPRNILDRVILYM